MASETTNGTATPERQVSYVQQRAASWLVEMAKKAHQRAQDVADKRGGELRDSHIAKLAVTAEAVKLAEHAKTVLLTETAVA